MVVRAGAFGCGVPLVLEVSVSVIVVS
jgi:hypothetical protein